MLLRGSVRAIVAAIATTATPAATAPALAVAGRLLRVVRAGIASTVFRLVGADFGGCRVTNLDSGHRVFALRRPLAFATALATTTRSAAAAFATFACVGSRRGRLRKRQVTVFRELVGRGGGCNAGTAGTASGRGTSTRPFVAPGAIPATPAALRTISALGGALGAALTALAAIDAIDAIGAIGAVGAFAPIRTLCATLGPTGFATLAPFTSLATFATLVAAASFGPAAVASSTA